MKTRTHFLLTLAVTIVLITGSMSHAQTDKTVIINQETATFGRAGDPSGFPIVIHTSGAYKLSSNIVVPDADTTAILITASHVSLDLNGFSILGPTICTGGSLQTDTVTNCSPLGTGVGVFAPGSLSTGPTNITVHNGTVSGMGRHGIVVGNFARVERIHASNNALSGISISSGVALHNTAARNGGTGISAGFATVLGNTTIGNQGAGISGGFQGGAAHNVILNNGTAVIGTTLMDGNVCDGVLCP